MSVRTSVHLSPGEALDALRATNPLVQCITNTVVAGFTANALLALGASPAMCDIPGEAGMFADLAGGVLINLGTPTSEQRDAALEAADSATPWVLDPVAVGALPVRTALARRLSELGPAVIRGNASEILALAGTSSGGRGVDAVDSPDDAGEAADALARRTCAVIAVSGAVDLITDGHQRIRVAGGDPLLTRVTGGGCALGATTAAFLSVCDPVAAAVAAHAVHAIAAERAAAITRGPGSFAVAFLDALADISAGDLDSARRWTDEPAAAR
ncbi:hydroxyethylthiazole kinase [Microbacterium sp. Marseille-Q6648]|uniref:hydroxyethylthiazole kinase n=1 Tax=Microbacterium sp. Marseille-Q6648 TaxID=2937991 RepID=UPI00203C5002|nr:hydroxyethylthiazole kinase [Microbacterium sp. Marseille-Q6648]